MRTETRRTQCCVRLVSRYAVVLFNTKYPKLPNFLCTGFVAVLPVYRDSTKLFHHFNALQSEKLLQHGQNLNHENGIARQGKGKEQVGHRLPTLPNYTRCTELVSSI